MSGVWGCHSGERALWGSVLSTAGRNCCNYTDTHRTEQKSRQRAAQMEKKSGISQHLALFLKNKTKRQKQSDYKIISSLSSELILWDCFKAFIFSVFVFVFILWYWFCYSGQTMLKWSIQRKIDGNNVWKRHIVNDPVISVVDESLCLLCWCNNAEYTDHFIKDNSLLPLESEVPFQLCFLQKPKTRRSTSPACYQQFYVIIVTSWTDTKTTNKQLLSKESHRREESSWFF